MQLQRLCGQRGLLGDAHHIQEVISDVIGTGEVGEMGVGVSAKIADGDVLKRPAWQYS